MKNDLIDEQRRSLMKLQEDHFSQLQDQIKKVEDLRKEGRENQVKMAKKMSQQQVLSDISFIKLSQKTTKREKCLF